jgi:tetraacyldisaccharide 4'-kinase
VDEKRVNGIAQLLKEEKKPDAILLDDAFQHRYVNPGLSILLVDYNRPTWRDCVLPFGRLRESAQGIRRAHAVVVTKCPADISLEEKDFYRKKLGAKKDTPIFFSTVCYDEPIAIFDVKEKGCKISEGAEILLLTGIARPEPLKKELEKRGAKVTLMKFPDHHHFTSNELKEIASNFESLPERNRIIITTEKDAERIVGRDDLPNIIKEYIYTIPIKVRIMEDEKMFNQIIVDYVRKNQRDR